MTDTEAMDAMSIIELVLDDAKHRLVESEVQVRQAAAAHERALAWVAKIEALRDQARDWPDGESYVAHILSVLRDARAWRLDVHTPLPDLEAESTRWRNWCATDYLPPTAEPPCACAANGCTRVGCKGECGCDICRRAWQDDLSYPE